MGCAILNSRRGAEDAASFSADACLYGLGDAAGGIRAVLKGFRLTMRFGILAYFILMYSSEFWAFGGPYEKSEMVAIGWPGGGGGNAAMPGRLSLPRQAE